MHSRAILVASALLALLSCGLPSVAEAQERRGFWISFGVGGGSAGISADSAAGTISANDRDGGAVVDLSLGWTLNHQLLLGVDFKTWAEPVEYDEPVTVALDNTLVVLTFYPSRSSGFFVKGGAGVSSVHFEIEDTPDGRFADYVGRGFGLMTGAGYDFRLGRGFSLVPEVSLRYGQPGDIDIYGQTQLRNWKHNIVDVTVSVAFHQMSK